MNIEWFSIWPASFEAKVVIMVKAPEPQSGQVAETQGTKVPLRQWKCGWYVAGMWLVRGLCNGVWLDS